MTVELVEVHLANRIARLSPEEVDEWARRAVKVFQSTEYLWTSFARVLTGNPSARVVMSAGMTRTDGTTIYYRPPLMLGDPSPHNRNQCDRRDPDGHLICPACSVRETVERSITHEIAHHTGGSFEKSSPEQQQTALRRAVAYARNPIAKAYLDDGLRKVKWGDDPQTMMFKMSSFLGLIIMALEDARIDLKMFKARPGVRKMFASSAKRLSTVGHVNLDGDTVRWVDNPLNAQIIIGLLWQSEGFDLGNLHDKVKNDLRDPTLQDICARVDRTGSALEIAALTIECLVRLWELGYCEPPEAMPEPPPYEPPPPPQEGEPDVEDEPEPEEEPGDDPGDQGAPDCNDGTEESPAEDSEEPGTDESDPGGGSPGEGDGGTQPEDSSGWSDGDGDEADSSGGSDISDPRGDESSSEQDGSEADDNGKAGSQPEVGPGDQDSNDDGGPEDTGDAEGGEPSEPQQHSSDDGNDEDRRDDDVSNGGDDDDLGESSDGSEDGSSGSSADDGTDAATVDEAAGPESDGIPDAAPEQGSDAEADADPGASDDGGSGEDRGSESVNDSPGGEDDGDSFAEGDRESEENKPGQSGPDLAPGSEPGARDSQADGDSGGADSSEGIGESGSVSDSMGSSDPGSAPDSNGAGEETQGIPTADASDVAPQGERADGSNEDGADEPSPSEDLPDAGTADDVAELIQDLTGHNHKEGPLAPVQMGDDPTLQRMIDKAIVQNQHFDSPSSTVTGLIVYEWPKHDGRCEAWARMRQPTELTIRRHDTGHRGESLWDTLVTPEEILQPALFEMKRVFADNERSRDMRNLKRGRLDGRSLGKRAWQKEPERLYKKHDRPKKRDYAVIIAGDCSWSQHLGKTMVVTKQAMFAQSELLNRMGIPFEVWATTAAYTEEYKRTREVEGYDMIMNQIKGWSDPWNEKQQEGLSWLHAVETNLDGHNLEFLRKRLMKSAATAKILLYYTDGEMPAANYGNELDVLERELDTYKRMNITLLGVGIGTDSPREYGLDTVRVDNKGDIVKVVKHLGGVLMNMHR